MKNTKSKKSSDYSGSWGINYIEYRESLEDPKRYKYLESLSQKEKREYLEKLKKEEEDQ